MFIPPDTLLSDNEKMKEIERIDARLQELEWGWADLARALSMTEQRINNWKKRGIPARELRKIEDALKMHRYALDGQGEDLTPKTDEDGIVEAINLFVSAYRAITQDGRTFMMNAIKTARAIYPKEDRRTNDVSAIKDRRKQ